MKNISKSTLSFGANKQKQNSKKQSRKSALRQIYNLSTRALLILVLVMGGFMGALVTGLVINPQVSAKAVSDTYPWKNVKCIPTGKIEGYCPPNYDWGVNGNPNNFSKHGNFTGTGYGYRNCTDWAAWRIKEITGKTVPGGLGNGGNWGDAAKKMGFEVDTKPEVGDAAVFYGKTFGHVAVVEKVNSNGTVDISEYNHSETGKWGTRSNIKANVYVDFTPNVNEGGQESSGGSKGTLAKTSDFNGNGNSDMLLYQKGDGDDFTWQGHDKTADFGIHEVSIGGDYKIAVGDFNGNKRADFVAYGLGPEQDYIYYGQETPGKFKRLPLDIDGYYDQLIPGDFDGDGRDDLMLYAPGGEDRVWYGTPNAASFDKHSLNKQLGSSYRITSGEYNNNKNTDLFLFNPNGEDFVLSGQDKRGEGAFTKYSISAGAQLDYPYIPVSGDFDGNGNDDILLHGQGDYPDYVLNGRDTSGSFTKTAFTLSGSYTPVATGDFNGDGKDDVFMQNADGTRSPLLSGTATQGKFNVYFKAPGMVFEQIKT